MPKVYFHAKVPLTDINANRLGAIGSLLIAHTPYETELHPCSNTWGSYYELIVTGDIEHKDALKELQTDIKTIWHNFTGCDDVTVSGIFNL